jgi:hypothetical protein
MWRSVSHNHALLRLPMQMRPIKLSLLEPNGWWPRPALRRSLLLEFLYKLGTNAGLTWSMARVIMIDMIDVRLMTNLKAGAIADLQRVTALARILPPMYLAWSDARAAALKRLIRILDSRLGSDLRA